MLLLCIRKEQENCTDLQTFDLSLTKVTIEYVRLCRYKNGEIGNGRKKNSQNENAKLSLDEIAKQLVTSKTNLTRTLSIVGGGTN